MRSCLSHVFRADWHWKTSWCSLFWGTTCLITIYKCLSLYPQMNAVFTVWDHCRKSQLIKSSLGEPSLNKYFLQALQNPKLREHYERGSGKFVRARRPKSFLWSVSLNKTSFLEFKGRLRRWKFLFFMLSDLNSMSEPTWDL